jgi:aspartyl/asparaginyl beta-hydroxylase (cupin superfamily)
VDSSLNPLMQAANAAAARARWPEALALLQQAHRSAPRDPGILMRVAHALRETGDAEGEVRAIEAALAADPYFLPALLARAAVAERRAGWRVAAPLYRNALSAAPPEPQWPGPLQAPLAHAKAIVARYAEAMQAFLEDRLATSSSALTPEEAERWREAGALVAGRAKPYPSVANRLQVPRLPALPFFPRHRFPWVAAIEAATPVITEEFRAVHARDHAEFRPYVQYAPGTPVNQWEALNHSTRWSSYFLWQNGAPVEAHQRECPATTAALAEVEMAEIAGLCPNAMFSALAPRTHIPPHHGETNARLVVHLPLIVPERCVYRVGADRTGWTVGEVLVFDDSIEHEARNDSDELRVVLIFDVWNPLLSPAEREMVRAISAATRDFHREE